MSAEAVQARLVALYTDGLLLLSKSQLLVCCTNELVNISILLNKKGVVERLKVEGLHIVIVSNQMILKLIGLLRT